MPVFHITSPDGHTYEVNAPEGATEQEALARVQVEHGGGPDHFPAGDSRNGPAALTVSPPEPKTSQALGFYQGIVKPFDNAAQALESGVHKLGVNTDAVNRFFGTPSSAQAKQSHADYIAEAAKRGVVPGGVGRFAGEMVGTAPLAAISTNPLALGAMSGAALTDSTDAEGIAKDAVIGGIAGKAGDKAISGISRVVSPAVNPYVRKLLDEGARLTPGQIMGGGFKRAEDALKSVPLLGDMVGNAQNDSIRSINTLAGNRALKPIGQTIPGNIEAGAPSTEYVGNALGDAYDQVLPHLSAAQDQQFTSELNRIAASNNLTPDYARKLRNILSTQIQGKIPVGTTLKGEELKGIDSELRRQAQGYSTDPSFDARELGTTVGDARTALKDMLARQNPSYADQLSKIDQGYANFARMRQAGSSVGAKEGVFTPAQLNNAVKASDKSAGKGNFAKGKALMQDLSTAADQVVTSKVNDSGTPYRAAAGALLAGAGAYISPASLVVSLGAMGAYTKPGLKALQVALTERPQAAKAIADLIRKGNAAGALAAANGLIGVTAQPATP